MQGEELNNQLNRLIHEEPSELELRQMWADRNRFEQLIALRDETFPDEYMPMNYTDYELWRAKLRAEMMSLTGVIDGMMICRENHLILPDWLSDVATHSLVAFSRPDNNGDYRRIRMRFKAERKKTTVQKRARIVGAFMRYAKRYDNIVTNEHLLRPYSFPVEIQRAINMEKIRASPIVESIIDAAELASICLDGTWAEAKGETIRQDYLSCQQNLKIELNVSQLSSRQAEFLGWDTEFIRPDTLVLLGLETAN